MQVSQAACDNGGLVVEGEETGTRLPVLPLQQDPKGSPCSAGKVKLTCPVALSVCADP